MPDFPTINQSPSEVRLALRHAITRAEHLSAAITALAAVTTEEEAAGAIIRHGRAALSATGTAVVLRRGARLDVIRYEANVQPTAPFQSFPIEAPTPAGEAMRTGEPLYLEHDDLKRRFPNSLALEAHEHMSLAALPLPSPAGVSSVLVFAFAGPLPSDPAELGFMQHLAAQCAQAFERIRLQREAHENAARFKTLVQATTSIVWTRDARGHIIAPQPQWEAYTGQPWEAYRGMGWLDAVHPDDRVEAERACLAGIASCESYAVEYRLRLHDGSYRTLRVNAVPIKQGETVREWIGFHRDVTDERAAQARTAALHAVTAELSEVRTAGDAARVILEHVRATIGAYAGTVLGIEGDSFVMHGTVGYHRAITEHFARFPLDAPVPVADAVRDLRPRYVNHDALQASYPVVAHVLRHPLERLAALPLVVNGRAVGGLVLSFADDHAFSVVDREFIEHFAHQCARSLDNIGAYERARDSEAKLAAIIDTVSDAIITTDEHRRVLVFNAAAERMFGMPSSAAIGRHLDDFVPGDRQHDATIGPRSSTGPAPECASRRAVRADGTVFDVEMTVERVTVRGEHLETAVLRDVTEQRRHEDALRASEERFRATFNQAAVGISLVSLDGRWMSVNDKLCSIVGYPRDDLLQRTFRDITHPDDLTEDLENAQGLLRGELRTYSMHKRYIRGDGTTVWANLTVSLVRNEDDDVQCFIAVVEDISDVKQAGLELARARDELEARVTERTAALEQLSEELQSQVRELEHHNHETRILSELGEMLQACLTVEEAQLVVAQHVQRLFPHASGALSSFGPSRNVLEELITWNGRPGSAAVFTPNECWALRRGRAFQGQGRLRGPSCQHTPSEHPTMCIPLLAQGETIGLLHLQAPSAEAFTARQERLAQTIAEGVALALVNLRLRDKLQQQSIRDALTGLFNRRYLEETFERELRRALRHGHHVGLVMLDVDHFKRVNDTHGHEAGDAVLRALGTLLKESVRAEDIACRYGGEEFALLLPGADLAQTTARAEHIRASVAKLALSDRGVPLGPLTASFGVTVCPAQGEQLSELVRGADFALYRAKQEGRNRVVAAS